MEKIPILMSNFTFAFIITQDFPEITWNMLYEQLSSRISLKDEDMLHVTWDGTKWTLYVILANPGSYNQQPIDINRYDINDLIFNKIKRNIKLVSPKIKIVDTFVHFKIHPEKKDYNLMPIYKIRKNFLQKGGDPTSFAKNQIMFGKMYKYLFPRKINCLVVNLLMEGHINYDGKIVDYLSVKKREMWAYLWYLWKNNNDITIFYGSPHPEALEALVNDRYKIEEIYITKQQLVNIINDIIHKNQMLKVPVLNTILRNIEKNLTKEEGVLQKAMRSLPEFEALHTKVTAIIEKSKSQRLFV